MLTRPLSAPASDYLGPTRDAALPVWRPRHAVPQAAAQAPETAAEADERADDPDDPDDPDDAVAAAVAAAIVALPDGWNPLVPTSIVAMWMGVTPTTLRRWCREGQFPAPVMSQRGRGHTKYWPARVVIAEYVRRHLV